MPQHRLLGLIDMVGRILRHFADMSDTSMATAIANVLESIGEFTGVAQSYLVEIKPGTSTIKKIHTWSVLGAVPQESEDLQALLLIWETQLSRGNHIYIPLVESLSEYRSNERDVLLTRSIRSTIVIPLIASETLHGFIGFESMDKSRMWDDLEITLLRSVADIIVGGLIRNKNHIALLKKEHQFQLLMQHSFDVITIINSLHTITYASGSIYALLGSQPEEWIGKSYQEVIHPSDLSALHTIFLNSEKNQTLGLPDFRIKNKNGKYHWFSGKASDFREDPLVAGWIINAHDITLRKETEQTIQYQAHHDALTGLSNRILLLERMAAVSKNNNQAMVGLLFIDLDHFKVVNDSLGHDIGDKLLMDVAIRLKEKAHASDTVARFGGDEFVILMGAHASDTDSIVRYAHKFLQALDDPFMVKDRARIITASGGVVIATDDWDPGALLRDADAAMYQAKSKGRNCLQVFDAKMQQILHEKLDIANDLRHSEQRGELYLMYQPVYHIDGVTLKSVEALIRWNHPQKGLVSPIDFIPVAEDTGMIIPIGVWVLNEALSQMRRWLDDHPQLGEFGVAVNLSAKQLVMPDLVDIISGSLIRHRVSAQRLTIELTESALMSEVEDASRVLHQLRDLGCKIAIDDFGTGYSSMAYLRDLPVTSLKIDRTFVAQILRSDRDRRIVAAMVNIANELDMNTVAEGVECQEQIDALRDVHCTHLQGYFLMRPSLPKKLVPCLRALELQHIEQIKKLGC